MPLTAPNVDSATNNGIDKAKGPKSLLAKVTATAFDSKISSGDKVV